MAKPTEQVTLTGKKSLGQTMLQGAKVLGGKEVPNYTLLFIDPTKNKKKGEYQTIVIPYIEIGRHGNCVVQYGDEHNAVHRKHAAILWDKGEVVIKHLGTNPLMVNGQPIAAGAQKVLQNADEIQLSQNGPRIRFNATVTKTSTMGVTQRMGLVLDQALKPYKTAVMGLAALLVGLVLFSGYQYAEFQKQKRTWVEQYEIQKRANDSLITIAENLDDNINFLKDDLDKAKKSVNQDNRVVSTLERRLKDKEKELQRIIDKINNPSTTTPTPNPDPDPDPSIPPKPLDTDGDGIPDSKDDCVNLPGPPANDGCPPVESGGSDGIDIAKDLLDDIFKNGKVNLLDGIKVKQLIELCLKDKESKKRVLELLPAYFELDFFPDEALGIMNQLLDGKVHYSDISEVIDLIGEVNTIFKDPDGDEVKGKEDKCPKEAGPKSNNGCPEPTSKPSEETDIKSGEEEIGVNVNAVNDKDGDGTPDSEDKCPEVKGLSVHNGCPPPVIDPDRDSDGDKIPDSEDDCPCVEGKKKRKGCPKGAKGDDFNKDCIS